MCQSINCSRMLLYFLYLIQLIYIESIIVNVNIIILLFSNEIYIFLVVLFIANLLSASFFMIMYSISAHSYTPTTNNVNYAVITAIDVPVGIDHHIQDIGAS